MDTEVQLVERGNGAKSGISMPPSSNDPFPPDLDEEAPDLAGITVRFTPEDLRAINTIAALWTAYDRAAGRKRRKWKAATIVRHAARLLIDQVKGQLHDWPANEDEQDAFIGRLLAARKAKSGKK